jgi:hypothetical protein
MSRISVLLGAILALGTGAAAHAETVSLTTDSWFDFDVDFEYSSAAPSDWISLDGSKIEFTLDSLLPVLLTIVDTGFAGDTFRVYDNGNLLGTTSAAASSYPNSVGLNADTALAGGNYSYALFALGAGSHVITGELAVSALDALGSALNATTGALRAVVVPLPASGLLLLGGTALLGALRRRFASARA